MFCPRSLASTVVVSAAHEADEKVNLTSSCRLLRSSFVKANACHAHRFQMFTFGFRGFRLVQEEVSRGRKNDSQTSAPQSGWADLTCSLRVVLSLRTKSLMQTIKRWHVLCHRQIDFRCDHERFFQASSGSRIPAKFYEHSASYANVWRVLLTC